MANIYDVANKAGVSRSAVSRVLNNQKGVHPDKREKVLEAVKALNYRPNSMARGLAMKKTNTIAIVARELADPFYNAFIRSLNYHADQSHYGVLYCVRNNYLSSNVDYLSTLSAKVDGYIFLGENTVSKEELELLSNTNTPVVGMEFDFKMDNVTFLTIDNEKETIKGIEYLINKGHKHILHIALDPSVDEFSIRENGYIKTVKKHKCGYSKVIRGDYEMVHNIELGESIEQVIKEDKVTAIFCANDMVAIGIREGLRNIGIADQIDILGFDGIYKNGYHALPITKIPTLKQPQDEMGKYAIDSIIKLIEEEEGNSYSKVFECELLV